MVAFAFLLQNFKKVVGTYESYFVSLWVQFEWGWKYSNLIFFYLIFGTGQQVQVQTQPQQQHQAQVVQQGQPVQQGQTQIIYQTAQQVRVAMLTLSIPRDFLRHNCVEQMCLCTRKSL